MRKHRRALKTLQDRRIPRTVAAQKARHHNRRIFDVSGRVASPASAGTAMMAPIPKLSVVAPCYNEQDVIEHFYRRITAAAQAVVGDDYEMILLNDRSSDATWPLLREMFAADPRLVIVNLSKRHGQQLALSAGLELSRGAKVLTIDSDLQDPPEL